MAAVTAGGAGSSDGSEPERERRGLPMTEVRDFVSDARYALDRDQRYRRHEQETAATEV